MYRKQVRRRRAVLVVLVVASLVLISTHFSEGEDGPLHSIQDGIGTVLNPIEDGASRALKPVRDLVNWFDETFAARGENDELRSQVEELSGELTATQNELEQGIERGRIAKITESDELAAYQPVDADVTIRSPTTWNQTLGINKGKSDGVAVDDPVIAAGGLVGRISSVNGGSARVMLLTDQESGVTAKVLDGGPLGTISAEVGNPDKLVFELIASDDQIGPGDKLVTAGIAGTALGSVFPAGIPIGEADKESAIEQELRPRILIIPFADMADLQYVTVLTGGPE